MELAHLEDGFYLVVNKLITDKTKYFSLIAKHSNFMKYSFYELN